jgi:hypothetical protein
LERPRFEDFEFTYLDMNAFGWFGDGWSERDRRTDLDKSYYLTTGQVDVSPTARRLEAKNAAQTNEHVERAKDSFAAAGRCLL